MKNQNEKSLCAISILAETNEATQAIIKLHIQNIGKLLLCSQFNDEHKQKKNKNIKERNVIHWTSINYINTHAQLAYASSSASGLVPWILPQHSLFDFFPRHYFIFFHASDRRRRRRIILFICRISMPSPREKERERERLPSYIIRMAYADGARSLFISTVLALAASLVLYMSQHEL